mmetsp:Transcript_89061/g.251359  ORF Transcript_89061/g.251359 Transcript_89061/m.251359 type:complete len:267 (+) Transcript_89061:90-890(+)
MLRTPSAARSISARRLRKRCAPSTPLVFGAAALVLGAVVFVGRGGEDFAYDVAKKGRNPAPYGRLSGRPIVPNPEAEKFPAGVPRDEDGFPLITLREQFDVNLTMYLEGIGPFTGEPTDFSGDWDFIPLDPEDEGFDPEDPMPRKPTEPPDELLSLQDPKSISIMKATPDEAIPEGKNAGKPPKRKVAMAAGSAPAPAAKAAAPAPAAKAAAPAPAAKAAAPAAKAAKASAKDYSKMKIPDLKKECEDRGLPSDGKKADLIARLEA